MAIELRLDRTRKLAQTVHIRGHALMTDVSEAEGGDDAGPSPHDLYDAALGACKTLTVMWYARKKGFPSMTSRRWSSATIPLSAVVCIACPPS